MHVLFLSVGYYNHLLSVGVSQLQRHELGLFLIVIYARHKHNNDNSHSDGEPFNPSDFWVLIDGKAKDSGYDPGNEKDL